MQERGVERSVALRNWVYLVVTDSGGTLGPGKGFRHFGDFACWPGPGFAQG